MTRTLQAVGRRRYLSAMARVEKAMRFVDTRVLFDVAEAADQFRLGQVQQIATLADQLQLDQARRIAILADQFQSEQAQQMAALADQFEMAQVQRMAMLAEECNTQLSRLVDDRSLEVATLLGRQFDEVIAPLNEAVDRLLQQIDLSFRDVVLRTAEAVAQHFEAQRRTLEELDQCASALEDDPRQEHRDAGVFLRKALDGYYEASEAQDDYRFADVIHWAVGALEEVVCQMPGVKAKTLGQALKELEAAGVISPEDGEWLEEAYKVRSKARGVGHGAGGAPEYVATYVLFRVRAGLGVLLPSLRFSH